MNHKAKVVVDLNCNMHYCAFYIQGLKEIFGKNIHYSASEFLNIQKDQRCFLFKVIDEDASKNYAIDFHDARKIDESVLVWSSVYAKINLHVEESKQILSESLDKSKNSLEKEWQKVISIPPSFGIRVFNIWSTIVHIIRVITGNKINTILNNKKIILDNMRMFIKRQPLSSYEPEDSKQNYVFLIASIWAKDTHYVNTNRANFIRACKKIPGLVFEGGFVDIGYECDYLHDIESLKIGKTKVSIIDYIKKTKMSNLVFNTPSVEMCHGWKLAEYLCLGKAVISTNLSNELPYPLVHGEHIHYSEENEEAISNAVKYLIENPDYSKKLEKGARDYWEKYATPEKVLRHTINK